MNETLAALEHAATTGEGNLLELTIHAARARATLGEISDALERVFTRHNAVVQVMTGAYGGSMAPDDELQAVRDRVARFASVQYKVKGPWQEPEISFEKPF